MTLSQFLTTSEGVPLQGQQHQRECEAVALRFSQVCLLSPSPSFGEKNPPQ